MKNPAPLLNLQKLPLINIEKWGGKRKNIPERFFF